MALRNILGITVGLAAALGGAALAARKLFGADESASSSDEHLTGGSTASSSNITPLPPREGLDPTLLEILACPDDKEPVIYQKEGDAERLTCTKCGKRYPVREGIPVMLIDEATAGPVPSADDVAAAKKLISEGKPAIVGAAASTSAPASGPAGAIASTPASSASPASDSSTASTPGSSAPATGGSTAEEKPGSSS